MGGFGSGRPSRPKEIKDLVGEKPSRQNNDVPQLEKVPRTGIAAPEGLTDSQTEVWEYYAPGLARAGVLALADVDMLAEFCVNVDTARVARERLEHEQHVLEDRYGKLYKNPWQTVYTEAVNNMQRIAARFGLTPADRARINVGGGEQPPEPGGDLLS